MMPVEPENSRPLAQEEEVLAEVDGAKKEAKRLRIQTAIPTIKAIKDELVARAKDGRLKAQLASRPLGSLIRDLAVIKQVLEDNMPQVVMLTPPAPASDGKDITWTRANTVVGKTEAERQKMRDAIEGEKA